MAFTTNYKIYHTNQQGDEITIDIIDMTFDPLGDTYNVTEIQAYAPALVIETFNTSDNEFSPIIGTRATITLRSTNAVNFATFAEGEDNRWFVRASYNSGTKFIFTGFLDMDDNQRPYLPHGQSFTISATDALGLLKNIPLSDFNNATPDFTSKQKLITVIQWCLHKTGLRDMFDRLHVVYNLFEENMADRDDADDNCPLNQTYVNIIDFCKSPNEFEDCFTVLEKILFSLQCRLTQHNNNWWIIRWDEYRNGLLVDYTSYFTGGVPASSTIQGTLAKGVDTTDIDLVKAETFERVRRAYKQALIKKKYDFPDELIRNGDFIRGAVIDDVLPLKTFVFDEWTKRRIKYSDNSEDTTTTHDVYIQRRYNTREYEIERSLAVTPRTYDALYREGVDCTPFPICEGDKFSFSLQWRLESDISGSGDLDIIITDIMVKGDDGSNWYLANTLPNGAGVWKWWDASVYTALQTYVAKIVPDNQIETEWQHISINYDDIPGVPVTGHLVIRLMSMNQTASVLDDHIINYQGLNFEYVPLVNGTYKKFDSEQWRMYTDDNYSKKFDEFFHLFDPPCKSFKGAMMYLDTGVYYPTTTWFDRAAERYLPLSIPSSMTSGSDFLRWQMFSVWNQVRRSRRLFNFSLYGFQTGVVGDHAGVIHQYTLQGYPNYFMILSMRQNWHDCTWTATMIEVNHTTYPREENNFEFRYIE